VKFRRAGAVDGAGAMCAPSVGVPQGEIIAAATTKAMTMPDWLPI
jgi:hypothetical protein